MTRSLRIAILGFALAGSLQGCGATKKTNDTQNTPQPSTLALSDIDASLTHACGIDPTGNAYCWGENSRGALGGGTDSPAPDTGPVRVSQALLAQGQTFHHIACGVDFSCALVGAENAGADTGLDALCWGSNREGQLGASDTRDHRNLPGHIEGSSRFTSISAGDAHACGVSSTNEIWCWGRNLNGQLGRGTMTAFESTPSPVERSMMITTAALSGVASFVRVAAGSKHTCALTTDGTPYCWGSDEDGQLGVGPNDDSTPMPVRAVDLATLTAGEKIIEIAAGRRHTCGLSDRGVPYCWGNNESGQIGDGTMRRADSAIRINVGDAKFFVQLTAGNAHNCGLTMSKIAYCWGDNANGQLGIGSSASSENAPSQVDASNLSGDVFVRLSAAHAGDYTCGLTANGDTYCFGTASTSVVNGKGGGDTAITNDKPWRVLRAH